METLALSTQTFQQANWNKQAVGRVDGQANNDKIKIFDSNQDFRIKIENLIFIEALHLYNNGERVLCVDVSMNVFFPQSYKGLYQLIWRASDII